MIGYGSEIALPSSARTYLLVDASVAAYLLTGLE